MTPYILLLLFITILGIFLCERFPSRRNDVIFLSLTSAVMLFMSIFRANTVGVDYPVYLEYFQNVREGGLQFLLSAENIYKYEPGYSLLNYLVSLVSGEQVVFAGVMAVIMLGLTVYFLYKHSVSVWTGMFVFVSFGFFGYTLVTIRQQMAVCIFMFALPHLKNKRLVPYILIVVLAALFHKSMWILLPFFWIAWIPLNWKTLTFYGTGTAILLLFTDPILNFVTRFIFTSYTEDSYYRSVGRNMQTAFIPIVLFLVAYLLKNRILENDEKNLPLINFAGYSCFLFILTMKSFIFQRVALVFLPVAVMLIPAILKSLEVNEEKYADLERLKEADRGQKKKYLELKSRYQDEKALYYATIGFILAAGYLYYFFLLNANRLLLVPYTTIWG